MTSPFVLRESRSKRRKQNLHQRSGEWLIVCGGEKTEVQYVTSLFQFINQYCKENQKMIFKVVGLSVDPKSLVEELQRKISQYTEKNPIYYSKIFVLFDCDDFPLHQIEEAVALCKANDYICCYSNVCFEVWLYLHFYSFATYIPRKDLFHKLSTIFHSFGIEGYQKNDVCLFQKMCQYGDILQAYKRAKQLKAQSNEEVNLQIPVTYMFRLLEEIDQRQRELELPSIHEIFRR